MTSPQPSPAAAADPNGNLTHNPACGPEHNPTHSPDLDQELSPDAVAAELPRPVAFSLRASVSGICNMSCQYCPRDTSMEDYTPDVYRGRGIGHDEYVAILTTLLATLQFSAVSLTGGEPTTNPHLADIAAAARPLIGQFELNTNGLLITAGRWARLAPLFDRVKISLDTLDPDLFQDVTQAAVPDALKKVMRALDIIVGSGPQVALNCVVSRDTLRTLDPLIAFASERGVRLHLLDYYFTEERRENWQRQFIPLESLMPSLAARFGEPVAEPIFGCGFFRYDTSTGPGAVSGAAPGAVLRLKTSYSGTMRAPRCGTCTHYCQEGMYGLKLSTDGWVTTCPSNEVTDGVLLQPDMTRNDVLDTLSPLLADLGATTHDPTSMTSLLRKRDLTIASPAPAGAAR